MDKNSTMFGRKKNLYGFLNFQTAPLMRCPHFHFPCSKGENILEKNIYCRDIDYISLRPSSFPIGSLAKILIPFYPFIKGTVLRDRFRKCWRKLTDLGLIRAAAGFWSFWRQETHAFRCGQMWPLSLNCPYKHLDTTDCRIIYFLVRSVLSFVHILYIIKQYKGCRSGWFFKISTRPRQKGEWGYIKTADFLWSGLC